MRLLPDVPIIVRGMLTAALLLSSLATSNSTADDVLQRIPDDAWGFLVIRDLAKANGQANQLLQNLDLTFPAPLTFVRMATGLDTGVNFAGDLAIALLPGDNRRSDPEPLVLLPISNYPAFAKSILADPSGEICRITLLGEDILVAQDGPYAMFMNVENRLTMESLLGLKPEIVEPLTPVLEWLPNQEIALVLLPAGIERASRPSSDSARKIGTSHNFSENRSLLYSLFSGILEPESLNWFRTDIELAAIGFVLDEQLNLRISGQLVPKKNTPLANSRLPHQESPVAKLGLAQQPFVFTAGGPWDDDWGHELASWFRKAEQQQAAENGLENVSAELWNQEEQAYQLLLNDVRACSVMMLPGNTKDPLVGNCFGIATVLDSTKYLESLPQVIKTWNEVTKQSTSDIQPEFELIPFTTANKRGYLIESDVAAAVNAPETPALKWMLESAFGPSGKLRARVTAIDATTLAFGFATEQQIEILLDRLKQGKADRPASDAAQKTFQLLSVQAPIKALIQPQGCVRWGVRVVNEFMAPLGNAEIKLPDLPDTPPLGLTIHRNQRSWECEIVCPVETLHGIASYEEIIRKF